MVTADRPARTAPACHRSAAYGATHVLPGTAVPHTSAYTPGSKQGTVLDTRQNEPICADAQPPQHHTRRDAARARSTNRSTPSMPGHASSVTERSRVRCVRSGESQDWPAFDDRLWVVMSLAATAQMTSPSHQKSCGASRPRPRASPGTYVGDHAQAGQSERPDEGSSGYENHRAPQCLIYLRAPS